jgi:hypothetical protein
MAASLCENSCWRHRGFLAQCLARSRHEGIISMAKAANGENQQQHGVMAAYLWHRPQRR